MQIIKHMCKRCIPSTLRALFLTTDEFQNANVEDENCWENEAAREEKENTTFYFDDS